MYVNLLTHNVSIIPFSNATMIIYVWTHPMYYVQLFIRHEFRAMKHTHTQYERNL